MGPRSGLGGRLLQGYDDPAPGVRGDNDAVTSTWRSAPTRLSATVVVMTMEPVFSGRPAPHNGGVGTDMTAIGTIALLVVADLGVVVGTTVSVGVWAPRWPDAWLSGDRGPLRLTRLDTVPGYRRLGVRQWSRRLPELGGLFGISKRVLPGRSRDELTGYLLEVRRAEWVHWLSLLPLVPLAVFNPWWLWLLFAVISVGVNVPFLAILRYNRVRLLALVPVAR